MAFEFVIGRTNNKFKIVELRKEVSYHNNTSGIFKKSTVYNITYLGRTCSYLYTHTHRVVHFSFRKY